MTTSHPPAVNGHPPPGPSDPGVAREIVRYEIDAGVVTITMDDPERRNALSLELRDALWGAFRRLAADEDARVAILTSSTDRSFCSGADLNQMKRLGIAVPPRDFVPLVGHNIEVDKPVIAAVPGPAIGGGLMMTLTCDIVLAAEHAVFGMPEARWGRGAPWSVPMAGMVSRRHWAELALTGVPIPARRAAEIGLVNQVLPGAELMARAREMAGQIAANAPLTVRATLDMIRSTPDMSLSSAWDYADAVFVPVYQSQDAQEGPAAFHERRPPRWQGA
ncbi:MAG TPA: enoyl-CoA hydratase/isomerase family protein [Pseudonocardia sp.]